MNDVTKSLDLLAERFNLSAIQAEKLGNLAQSSVSLEISGTAIASAEHALDLHIADSLAGLEIEQLREAASIADIGAGVGFPGIVLAVALPDAQVTLVDSVRKKMEAAAALAREIGADNVECVWARVEDFSALGAPARESYDAVTARALAPLTALIEYSSPLLRVGGTLVAWKGDPEASELFDAHAAEQELGFSSGELVRTVPFKGSRQHHFYVCEKREPASDRFPRRPGAALRKPISA
jgi:16S rRNA (guanine527-N7)-methyltransferase